MRLGVRVGNACADLLDRLMQDLALKHVQLDEIWCFVQKKQRHVRILEDESTVGDFWTFVAIDSETKLVPSFKVGKRTAETTHAFVKDLSGRVRNRLQISSDAMTAYADAIEMYFGTWADYGQVVKSYEAEPIGPGRYSPPRVTSIERNVILGKPKDKISTSYVERQNLTMRMNMRRFTRLTNGFSKKPENLRAAVALHFAHYNLVRVHQTLRVTPAMAAEVTDHVWTVPELMDMAN